MNTNPSTKREDYDARDHATEVEHAVHGGAGPEMTEQADPAQRYHVSGSSQPGDAESRQHQQAQQ